MLQKIAGGPDWDLDVGVIYTYEREFMDQLVPSLAASGDELKIRLILVDNASRDGMPSAIERAHAHDPRLKVIYNHKNLGFGPAVNLAAKQANGHALLILNPDCVLHDDDLRRLLALQAGKPKAGLSLEMPPCGTSEATLPPK